MNFRVGKEKTEEGNIYQIHFVTNEIVDSACLGFSLFPLSEKDLLKLKKEIEKALVEGRKKK